MATPATGVLGAGIDEVSAAVAAFFNDHAQSYQAVSAEVKTFHAQFAQNLGAGAAAYESAEAANANPMQTVLDAINSPTESLLGRPLIGNGTAGNATNPDGGDGGLLYGNGGNGYNSPTAGVTGGKGGDAWWHRR